MFSTTASASTALQWSQPGRELKFHEILSATQDFDESLVIGHGGFGKVYKGSIFNGSTRVDAAIKRLDSMSDQGKDEFWAEVEMLSNLRHIHLVSLIGYCNHGNEMILVYEYMPNGTLEDHLHKLGTPLSWLQRLNICLGAARGLDYLHTGTGIESGVVHRDVKTSNILLHESWAPKISDLGLSIMVPRQPSSSDGDELIKGTFGYMDPDYYYTGKLTSKSDVYAFGVVLFEVLCRKRAADESLDWGLAKWAQDSIKEGKLKHIIDFDIRDQASPKCLKEFVRIAQRCLHDDPMLRVTMADVVVKLQFVLTLEEKNQKSLQAAGRTIFRKVLHILPFTTKQVDSASNSSSSGVGNNTSAVGNTEEADNNVFLDTREVSQDLGIPDSSLKVFKFADLETATSNFSRDMRLGRGGFGKAFLGWIDENTFFPSKEGVGIAVAVKRRHQVRYQGHGEWLAEVSLLGQAAHPNIISLLGYCSDEHKYLLVYEYIHTRSYDDLLFTNSPEPLSWGTRLSILIGVARGLTYLHSLKDPVVCRGVKSSDILLDHDFNAKLGDFGVARFCPNIGETVVTTAAAGTLGYIDPHYYATGQVSAKTDIYGFGVVLVETLTGLRAWDIKRDEEQHNLVYWTIPILKRGQIDTIIDPHLKANYPLKAALESCVALALKCLVYEPKDRPSSEEVLRSLEQIYDVSY